MKRFLVVFLVVVLLFVFASCQRRPTLEEQYDSLSDEYADLEEKYYQANDYSDSLLSALSDINDNYNVAWSYYDDHDPYTTEEEAHAALLRIGDILEKFGY